MLGRHRHPSISKVVAGGGQSTKMVGSEPRGAAYLTTLLTVAVTASIVLALVAAAVTNLRNARVVVDTAAAQEQLQVAVSGFEARLQADPWGFYRRVDEAERARVCIPTGTVVEPGEDWDLDLCGVRWSYVQATAVTAALASGTPAVRVEVTPPTSRDPQLHVDVLVNTNSVEVGRRISYVQRSPAEFTVHADDSLDLNAVYKAPASVLLSGQSFYTPGTLILPDPDANTRFTGALFASDGDPPVAGTAQADSRYFTPSPTGREEDVRGLVAQPLRTAALGAATAEVTRVGCSGTPTFAPFDDGKTSGRLCLREGWVVTDATGVAVSVPDGVAAYSMTFAPASDGTAQVDVAYATDPAVVSSCTTPCSLPNLASTVDVPAGTHPGDASYWTPLGSGTFHLPDTGIVVTDADTYIGRCGYPAFTDPSATCATSEVTAGVTVVVGTVTEPAHLWISGSVAAPGGQVALVATGDIAVGYWARTPGGDVRVDAALLALGLADKTSRDGWVGELRTYPVTVCTDPAFNCDDNLGDALIVTGSVASREVDLDFGQYTSVRVVSDPQLISTPPPHVPTFDPAWVPTATGTLTGPDVCGRRVCPLY